MSHTARFGPFTLDLQAGQLRRGDVEVPLQPAAFQLLAHLARNAGLLLGREDLHKTLWRDTYVGDEALSQMVRRIRRALEEDADSPLYLQTLPRRGYRFIAKVEWLEAPEAIPPAPPLPPSAPLPPALVSDPEPFFGRAFLVQALRVALEQGARLITLLGAGGMGKTRLALHFLSTHPERKGLFVDLSEVHDLDQLALLLGSLLDVPVIDDLPQRNLDRLARALARDPRRLIVLDNAESMLQDIAETLRRWRSLEPALSFLVTSRERLDLQGEVVLTVSGLEPDAAAALFLHRAHAAGGRLASTTQEHLEITTLASRLDGSPLALELAAGRAALMSVQQILEHLDSRFQLLRSRRRDIPDRHRSLLVVIEDSVERLPAPHRAVLDWCRLFPGPVRLETLVALIPPDALDGWLPDLLQDLLERSLLQTRTQVGSPPLFVLQENVRSYLSGPGGRALEALRNPLREPMLTRLLDLVASARPDPEMPTLLEAACQDLEAPPAWKARAALGTAVWLRERGPHGHSRQLLEAALAARTWLPTATVIELLAARAGLESPGQAAAMTWLDEARGLALEAGLHERAIELRLAQLDRWISQGRYREALEGLEGLEILELSGPAASPAQWAEQAGGLASAYGALLRLGALQGLGRVDGAVLDTIGRPWRLAPALPPSGRTELAARPQLLEIQGRLADLRGYVLGERGRYTEAILWYRWALEAWRTLHWRRREAVTLVNLSSPLSFGGQEAEAVTVLDEALSIFEDIGDAAGLAAVLTNRSLSLLLQGRLEEAGRDIRRGRALARACGMLVVEVVLDHNLSSVHWLEGALTEALFACERGLELASAHAMAERVRQLRVWRAGLLGELGQEDEAELELARARGDGLELEGGRLAEALEAVRLCIQAARLRRAARAGEPGTAAKLAALEQEAKGLSARVGPQARLLLRRVCA